MQIYKFSENPQCGDYNGFVLFKIYVNNLFNYGFSPNKLIA